MNPPEHTINKEMPQSEHFLPFHTVSMRKTCLSSMFLFRKSTVGVKINNRKVICNSLITVFVYSSYTVPQAIAVITVLQLD